MCTQRKLASLSHIHNYTLTIGTFSLPSPSSLPPIVNYLDSRLYSTVVHSYGVVTSAWNGLIFSWDKGTYHKVRTLWYIRTGLLGRVVTQWKDQVTVPGSDRKCDTDTGRYFSRFTARFSSHMCTLHNVYIHLYDTVIEMKFHIDGLKHSSFFKENFVRTGDKIISMEKKTVYMR